MRAPFGSDSSDICPDDKGSIGSDNTSDEEIHAIGQSLERSRHKTAVFGTCLDDLMGTTKHVVPQVPFILSRLCRYIEKYGLQHRSLFLEVEEKLLVEQLKVEFIESGDAPLEETGTVASAARLLVIFFEELPEPLISKSTQWDLIMSFEKLSLNSEECVPQLKENVEKLPCGIYQVLKYLSCFLKKVSYHAEFNGMSSENLAVIFTPLIFRQSSNDSGVLLKLSEIVSSFVKDYCTIFGDVINEDKNYTAISPVKSSRQTPSPSSVVPVTSLLPLSVYIPQMNEGPCPQDEKIKDTIPILLIEGKTDSSSKDSGICEISPLTVTTGTRKRKERRFSGEDSQQRSSSEERPAPNSSASLDRLELLRRCNSHEEVNEDTKNNSSTVDVLHSKDTLGVENKLPQVDTYLSRTVEVINEKNLSPHPPLAKRREVENEPARYENHHHKSVPWKSPNQYRYSRQSLSRNSHTDTSRQLNLNQNSIAKLSLKDPTHLAEAMEEDKGTQNGEDKGAQIGEDKGFQIGEEKKQEWRLPKSASYPVSKSDNSSTSSEDEESGLSLSWSMLFEESEPIRSEHPVNWSMTSEHQDDDALLSPSVQKLRNSNYYEAPLSPSAYRSYLSYRSTHLDPSVPPSPPVEQEDFAKKLVESNTVSDSIKKFTKSIHVLKKKIRKFDEKFEVEFGYKPSHAEKSIHPEAKVLLKDLSKARKDLKALKEEAHLDHVSSASVWHSTRYGHILGDTTNQFLTDSTREKNSVEFKGSFGKTLLSLVDKRKLVSRPEELDDMTSTEVEAEKADIQAALLDFEKQHGRAITREEKNTTRPLYDRYRFVKKMLVRAGSFPGSKNNFCGDLTPILEHETMDFPKRESVVKKTTDSDSEADEEVESHAGDKEDKLPIEVTLGKDEFKATHSSSFMTMKYDNSNIHELPLSEMIFQLQKVKAERRHLHRIIKEFENEFKKLNNGRKPEKADKKPLKSLYIEHRHVKARCRLLEALISKYDQHQLM